jgi:hypothetical protein
MQWLLSLGRTKEEYQNSTVAPAKLSNSGNTLKLLFPSTVVPWSLKSPGGWKRKHCVADLIDLGMGIMQEIKK